MIEDIKWVDVSTLKPNPKNNNIHTPDQIERLAKILKYQKIRSPIIVSNRSGFITKGHATLEAIKLNGWTKAPVSFQDYEDETQEFTHMTSDNSIAAWSEIDLSAVKIELPELGEFDHDLLGFREFSFEEENESSGDADAVPEPPKVPKSKLGDLWILGSHRLICGDSTDKATVERLMNGEKAELCFTSPPYADQREYRGGKELSTEHLARFITTAKPYVNYFAVNLGISRKNGEINSYWDDYISEAKSCGLKFLSWNIWNRGRQGSIGLLTAMFIIAHEWILVFGDDRKAINKTVANKSAGQKRGTADRQADGTILKKDNVEVNDFGKMGTVLDLPAHLARNEDVDHPAMFPVALPQAYIESMTAGAHGVYEPFGGSGSTLIACEKTNRRCFMMELDPIYIDVILQRWSDFTGQDPVREDGTKWSELNETPNQI